MRFSLRALMIFVTLICILLGSVFLWYRTQEAELERQQAFAEQITQLGARVYWSDQTPKPLRWIGSWKCFQRIEQVAIAPDSNPNRILEILTKLPRLQAVCIYGRMLNEEFLHGLSAIKGLEKVVVIRRSIADQEMFDEAKMHQEVPHASVEAIWED